MSLFLALTQTQKDAQSGSVLLGDKTTGKTATTVNDATVNGLTLKILQAHQLQTV